MADPRTAAVDARQKFVEAWNKTMIDIWDERIYKLKVIDTGALWRSPLQLPVRADGRFYDITLSQNFLEYGLWQDLGVGREVPHGNSGDIGRDKVRERRRWFSVKYYSSVMNLRDFMAESLGDEFRSMFCAALDSDNARYSTEHYRRMGYTR
jgi:hypothetical protein